MDKLILLKIVIAIAVIIIIYGACWIWKYVVSSNNDE